MLMMKVMMMRRMREEGGGRGSRRWWRREEGRGGEKQEAAGHKTRPAHTAAGYTGRPPNSRNTCSTMHPLLAGIVSGSAMAPHGASDAWLVHGPRALALPGRLSWECMALGGFPNQGKFREPQGA